MVKAGMEGMLHVCRSGKGMVGGTQGRGGMGQAAVGIGGGGGVCGQWQARNRQVQAGRKWHGGTKLPAHQVRTKNQCMCGSRYIQVGRGIGRGWGRREGINSPGLFRLQVG